MHRNLRKITTGLALTTASLSSWGAGFQLTEHSASGLGRAFAGEAAVADNAAVIASNPAAMNYFDTMQISAQASYVLPALDIEDFTNNQTADNIAPSALVPGAFYIAPVNDIWSFGMALYSNYGVSTDFPKDWVQGDNAGLTSLVTVNVSPSFAFRIIDGLSFGFAVDFVYGDAELERFTGGLAPVFNSNNPSAPLIKMEGDTNAWGWNAGLFYEINENNRLGFNYTSEVILRFDGEFTDYTGSITGTQGTRVTGELPLTLPAIAEFGGYHQINENWAIHHSIVWTQWSRFKELRATNPACTSDGVSGICFLKEESFKDSFRWALGSTVKVDKEWLVRFGIAYDERAGEPTLSIPDSDRYWLSAGTTWAFSEHSSIDAGIAFLFSQSSKFSETGLTGTADFEASGYASIYSIQYNYSF